MKKLFEELKRRNVIKATIAYLVVSWLLLQVFSIVLPAINAPTWVLQAFLLILAIGFPIWLFFSWVYEMTPEGIKKTKEIEKDLSITAKTNKRLNILILITLIIVIALFWLKPNSNIIQSEDGKYGIAVLPFVNMSADQDNVWFCKGVTEDILTYLSKIKGLRVISRTSTEQYKVTDKTIPEIAQELNVSYIVEGSVRKQGNKVLITAQLIDANDNHLWADNYYENLDDILKIQQEVSKKIVRELEITLSPKEEKSLEKYPTTNPKAYQLFIKGRSYANRRNQEDLVASIGFFQQAIELDPEYAEAYAEMAHTLRLISDENKIFENDEDRIEQINKLLDKAFEIDPNTVRYYSTKGIIYFGESKYNKAKEYYEKAIELNPNDATTYHYFALFYSLKPESNFKKALELISIANKLEPYSNVLISNKIIYLLKNNKLKEAEEFYKINNSYLSEAYKIWIGNYLIRTKARIISFEKKDWRESIKFYHKAVEEDSLNPEITLQLGGHYFEVLNDKTNFIKYAKKAFELDSNYMRSYFNALLEGGKYKEAENFMKNNIEAIQQNQREPIYLFDYYYYQKKFKEAQKILNDNSINNPSFRFSRIHAQLNNIKEVYQILNSEKLANSEKAIVFAILKERDSMYYYINKELSIYKILEFNGYNELDPYRKEERYKEYLQKNYLPITHWNE